MQRSYYSARIREFLDEKPETLLGKLMVSDEFSTTDLQKNAWRKEIDILQDQLRSVENGDIAFDYTIPTRGHRIDVVRIIRGLNFLLEFKVGDSEYRKSTADQVMDYALDLKYFHELSADRYIIPISIPTEAPSVCNEVSFMEDKISNVLKCMKDNSSYFFEVAASEFKVQGLEIDYSILAWDADLRRSGKGFDYFKFRGTRWNHVNNMQQQKYLKNAYRVLMTRARQGMIIFVPSGTDPEDDPTRDSAFYDDIYKYLRSCGIKELM